MADLDTRLASGARDMASVKEKIAVLKANANKLNPNSVVTSTETIRYMHYHAVAKLFKHNHSRAVHVGLEARAETKAILYLSYVVTNASWSSAYDARVFTKDKLMKVSAIVYIIFC